jgi:hypothetical protein
VEVNFTTKETKETTMSKQEEDLAELKRERARIQEDAFSYMRDILCMSEEQLKCVGYKSHEEWIVSAYLHAQKDIDNKIAVYIAKYPD